MSIRDGAAAASPMQKSGDPGILYRTNANGAQATTVGQHGAVSESEAYPAFSDLRAGICQFVVEFVRQKLSERDRKIERLEAQIEMLIALLGKSETVSNLKGADVIDLPRFIRKVRDVG
jgi:hypothetical protein